ncbi:MAG: succinate dehydrogenase cytochrome b subunit [Dehalococcoidia bacterium]|nr:succinate dehydrogenase cytochrome b subunit [Dehalococcoidia bacterium]
MTPARTRPRPHTWIIEFYSSAIGKKAVMAVTGLLLLGFVLVHMLGNLKLYYGEPEHLNEYGHYLRTIGEPILPHSGFLWIMRGGLILAFVLHIHAAVSLTMMNRRARPVGYKGGRTYSAANYAARTMRWSGIIVGLYLLFHLADLTWGTANPDFEHGEPYQNMIASFERVPVAIVYVVANLLLGIHIFHGAWSLFQSLGWSNPRFNVWRRYFAVAFAAVIVVGNVSFPLAVLFGVVD